MLIFARHLSLLPPPPPPLVVSQRPQQQCINLLTNACKYTVKGYIHLEVSVVLGKDLPRSPLLRGNTRMNEAKSTGGPEGRNDSRGHVRQASTPSGPPRTSGGRRPPTGKGTVCPVTCRTDREDSTSSSLSGQPTDWDAKKFLSFNVRDTGVGVTHENKAQLFKAFTQVQSMQSHGKRRDGRERRSLRV